MEVAEKIATYLNLSDYLSFEQDRPINDAIYPSYDSSIYDELGWKPSKNLDDFLPETIEWYREHLDQYRAFSRAKNKGYSILKILHIIAGAKRGASHVPSIQ